MNRTALGLGSGGLIAEAGSALILELWKLSGTSTLALSPSATVFFNAIMAHIAAVIVAAGIIGIGIGGALTADVAVSLNSLANEIEAQNRASGVGLASDGSSIYILDREDGSMVSWTPGVSLGANIVMGNIPEEVLLNRPPTGDSSWTQTYHFASDNVYYDDIGD